MEGIFRISMMTISSAFFSEAALAIAEILFKRRIYYYFIILNIPVPQVTHLPFIASLLFFIVTFCVSFISLLDLHFTQYPVSAIQLTSLKVNVLLVYHIPGA